MGLFSNKKKELIPDVDSYTPSSQSRGPPAPHGRPTGPNRNDSVTSAAPSYRSTGPYVPPSQGGQGYAPARQQGWNPHQQQQPPQQQPYIQAQYGQEKGQQSAGYPNEKPKPSFGRPPSLAGPGSYSRREELMSSAASSRGTPSAYGGEDVTYGGARGEKGGFGDREGEVEKPVLNEEDEEVEGIKQQMRFVKQESLASSRNAVRIAREAEETARATLDKLGDQSDRVANTERNLDLAKAHNERAIDETKELEALNRSIFRPSFTWNKAAKRDKEELRILNRHNAEQAEREEVRREQYESRVRIEGTYAAMDRVADEAAGNHSRSKARGATGAERLRYQFEATGSDDDVEDEIDENLSQLSGVAGRLKMLAMTAGAEVDSQNNKIGKLAGKVDDLDNNVHRSTARLARVK